VELYIFIRLIKKKKKHNQGMSYIVFFLCFSDEYLQTGLYTDSNSSEMEKKNQGYI